MDDVFGQPQLPADIKCVTAARYAHEKPVGRKQSIRIKFHAGIFHPLPPKSKGLQLAVMGGHHGENALLRKMIQNGHGQGCPFVGIRACTNLIHQHQVPFPHFAQNAHNIHHMPGKSREALFDALLVPDIRIHRPEYGQFRIHGGNEHPCLAHEGKEAHRLQGYGLTAGVGAGDQQGVKSFP